MATTKKTIKKPASKKKNNAQKDVESVGVVDEFLETVVGFTMTQEDADNNENRKKELNEKDVKENVVDIGESGVIGTNCVDGTTYVNSNKLNDLNFLTEIEKTDSLDITMEEYEDFNKKQDIGVKFGGFEDGVKSSGKTDEGQKNGTDEIGCFVNAEYITSEPIKTDNIAPQFVKKSVSTPITIVSSAMGASWD